MRVERNIIKPARIEMLPLIDIVFLLLVFFIYAMLSMAVHRGQPVDLPTSSTARIDTAKAIAVTIRAGYQEAKLLVDEEPVSLDGLAAALHIQCSKDPTKREVQIFADKSVSYQELFQVLDRIRQAGLERISLAAATERQ